MAIAANYDGRSLDLLMLNAKIENGQYIVQPGTSFHFERGGFVVAGPLKLAQKVFLSLLNAFPRYDLTWRSPIPSVVIESGSIQRVRTELPGAFAKAIAIVRKNFQQEATLYVDSMTVDTPIQFSDELLRDIEVTSLTFDESNGSAQATIRVLSQANRTVTLLVPIDIVV